MDNQQVDSPPQWSPSPTRAASPVVDEASASPIVHCSQYRVEEYERQNGPLSGHEPHDKLTVPAAPCKDQYVSDSDSEYGRPRRRRRRSPPITRVQDGVLYVHKDYEGRLPLCYYDTGLREYGTDDGYACFDMRDIRWARRLRFHIERLL
jgi:hypothetical protein